MTHKRLKELEEIADKMEAMSNIKGKLTFTYLKDYWEYAVMYNRKQNTYLKDGYSQDVVKNITAFDEVHKKVREFRILANRKLTRKQWFALIVANDYYYLTIQQTRKIVES